MVGFAELEISVTKAHVDYIVLRWRLIHWKYAVGIGRLWSSKLKFMLSEYMPSF